MRTAPEVLAGDTRGLSSRGTWPGRGHTFLPIGDLWLYEREDGRWDILEADPLVIVSREFVQRVAALDPEPATAVSWRKGALVAFSGVRETVTYRVVAHEQAHGLFLLRRVE